MQVVDVASWEHFEVCVSELNAYLFKKRPDPLIAQAKPLYRGHADAVWTLATTLERFRSKPTSVEQYNHYLLRIKPAVESYTDKTWAVERDIKLPDDWLSTPPNYEFMVYARHHGFPSPLLDWSQSPYIALYFAYAGNQPNTNAAVYAYVSTPEGVKGGWATAAAINELGPYATTHARHFRQQAQYTVCVHKPEKRWDYCSHEGVFKSGDDSQDLLRKFILPGELRLEFLKKLQLMNINAYSLFNTEEALMHMLAFKEITLLDL